MPGPSWLNPPPGGHPGGPNHGPGHGPNHGPQGNPLNAFKNFSPQPPRPVGPPPTRYNHNHYHHSSPSLGGMIAGTLISAAVGNAINDLSRSATRAMTNGSYNQSRNTYNHSNASQPTRNYPSTCPNCGASTSGMPKCDYCGGIL